jgi:hypothetical protein
MLGLTGNGKALVVTLFFRLLFGGYIAAMDQYRFSDIESALTVLLIYGLIAIFAILFLLGKRQGLIAVIGLDAVFITLQSIFTIVTVAQIADAGLHDPMANWWATLLMYLFSLLTLIFSIRAYKETKQAPSQDNS